MKNFDNNMEMFDAYLNGEMSSDDRKEFEAMLESDNTLKQEFKDYKELLCALQASCSDADKEFEEALRNISDEDINSIVASKKVQGTPTSAEEKPKGKVVPLRTIYRWVSAAAAVLLIVGVGTHFYLGRQARNEMYARNEMCDEIVANHKFNSLESGDLGGKSRGASDNADHQLKDYNEAISLLNSDKTDEAIKILENLYKTKETNGFNVRVRQNCPITLAYAYVKNHDIDNAKRIISEVKKELDNYTPSELLELEKELDKKK